MNRFDEPHIMYAALSGSGEVIGPVTILTHRLSDCEGDHCAIHNPSNHPLRNAPMTFREDKGGLIERQCEHGIGHTDPDSLAFLERDITSKNHGLGVHGCDGCCGPSS